jgi:hypothetical protein
MNYKKPNFNWEWKEATRYPFFKKMGKKEWIEYAKNNFQIIPYKSIKKELGNVDLDFESLDEEKKKRFEKAFTEGVIEIPIAVQMKDSYYDLVAGNTRLAGLVKNGINPKIWVIDVREIIENYIDMENIEEMKNPCWKGYKMVGTKKKGGKEVPNCVPIDETSSPEQAAIAINMKKKGIKPKNESDMLETDSSSSGAFATALDNPIKRPAAGMANVKKYNKQGDVKESLDASASGSFDVPLFGTSPKGRKNPLSIGGTDTIYKGRAVKDKNFPKWGGPGGVFVKIKDKCKKFPYCNQGDINAIEILHEAIQEVAKNRGFSTDQIEKLVLNEIKKIFI